MAVENRRFNMKVEPGRNGSSQHQEPPVGDLFRQLTEDATTLIRQEIALGKAELRQSVSTLSKGVSKLAIAAGLALMGGLAAVAFLIIALGDLLDNYWLSALIVAAAFLGIAAVMGKGATRELKSNDMKPTQTIDTLKADAEWAKREIATVKREWQQS